MLQRTGLLFLLGLILLSVAQAAQPVKVETKKPTNLETPATIKPTKIETPTSKRPSHSHSENSVGETVSETYETSLHNLLELKGTAFEKYRKAWETLCDWTATVTDEIKAAFKLAADDYHKAREALWKFGTESLDSSSERYNDYRKTIEELEDQIRVKAQNMKKKAADQVTEEEWDLYIKQNELLDESRRRFHTVREQLERYFKNAYDYGKQDYDYAQASIDQLKQELSSYPKTASIEGKKRIEEALDTAKYNYEAAKVKLDETKKMANKFYNDAKVFASKEEEYAKLNLDYWTTAARDYAEHAKDKTAEVYTKAMEQLDAAKEEANEQFESAQLTMESLRNVVETWTEQAKEFAQESYEKVKSEL
jgi:hypothetical protein